MNLSFIYSLLGHILIGLLLFVSLPSFQKTQTAWDSAPVIVNLKDVEISDVTNLPAKGKNVSALPAEKSVTPVPKPVKSAAKTAPAPATKKAPEVKPVQKTQDIKDAAKAVESVKKETPKPKAKPKAPAVPKAKNVPIKTKPAQQEEGLDSLLASVEKMASSRPEKSSNTKKSTGKSGANMASSDDVSDLVSGVLSGIDGGNGKSFGTKLTISQIDFIASSVRKYWNLGAGVDGIENMVVEIKVSLTRSGKVSDVEFLNKARYNQDTAFRSIADSAKRAVYIADNQGDESPFRMLAVKYPERYSDWQKLHLRFNPLDGGVS